MYTIKRAAELTGVSEATLRAWERRYGVLTPQRSPGHYRLYDDASLDTVRAMQALLASGWAAGPAAEQVRGGWRPQPPEAAGASPSDTPGGAAAHRAARTSGDPDGAAQLERFRQAAIHFDSQALTDILDERFGSRPFETVVDDWLMPALTAIGDDWAAGLLSVAGEHFVANAVQRRLATAYEAAYRPTSAPRVIAGLPPGAGHDLGLLAFAVAARRAGLATTYLGANVPVDDWVVAVGQDPSAFVVLAVPRRKDLVGCTSVVRALRGAYAGVRVGVGGRYQERAPAEVARLGHRIGPAADRLARELASLAPA